MNLIFQTLHTASTDILFFSIIFIIVMLGFSMSFYMAFGLDVEDYRSAFTSFISLLQARRRLATSLLAP